MKILLRVLIGLLTALVVLVVLIAASQNPMSANHYPTQLSL
jgi:hypothetical protein